MTTELITFASFVHVIGTFIGLAYCTFAEIFFIKAASDGIIDKHERKYLRRLFRALHVAVPIVLLSSIMLIVLEYLIPNARHDVLSAPFWIAQTLIAVIIGFGYALQKRGAPWWIASSAMVTGWWMLAFTDLGYFNSFGYTATLMLYLLVTFIVAGIVGYVRLWTWTPRPKE